MVPGTAVALMLQHMPVMRMRICLALTGFVNRIVNYGFVRNSGLHDRLAHAVVMRAQGRFGSL